MEGKIVYRRRTLARRFESNRLEEQVWALAYEQVWPLLRKALKSCHTRQEESTATDAAGVALARSA